MNKLRMMQLICLLLLCGLMLKNVFAATEQPLEAYLGELNKQAKPFAVVLYRNGKFEQVASKMQFNTPISIGRLSELLTVLLLAKEVDKGRMQLDHLVSRYIVSNKTSINDLSLLQLATQTSGLDAEVNLDLLSKTLAKRNKDHYWHLLTKNVLKPLGLQSAKRPNGTNSANQDVALSLNDLKKILKLSIGHTVSDDWLYPMRMTQVNYWQIGTYQQALIWHSHPAEAAILGLADLHQENTQPVKLSDDPPIFDRSKLYDIYSETKKNRIYIAVMPGSKTGILIVTDAAFNKEELIHMSRELLLG